MGAPNPSKFDGEFKKNVGSFPDHFWDRFSMDFGAILARSWEPKWSKNRYKRGLENDEKIMMSRMAKKLDIGVYECVRPDCPEPRGGGRRRANPPSNTVRSIG